MHFLRPMPKKIHSWMDAVGGYSSRGVQSMADRTLIVGDPMLGDVEEHVA